MKKCLFILISALLFSVNSFAAVLHFYSNPNVPQPLFHVILEYKGYAYEADTRAGGRRLPIAHLGGNLGHIQIEISDSLVNEQALMSQMGLPFDYKFIWNNNKTYCSKLVGIALNMEPQPMTFAGTHYVQYYPDWIYRNDPGLSPDQVYEFGMQHALRVTRKNR
ncbi:hypothetical protein EZJ49_07335 [Bdellovibrio bacteriovorus]|uniref:hypothetical protein n=1 Tax=Bdellovibrio bacteriovorus TaxID=959 RepID=UPI0021D38BAC|nr:hypothetical protein [Bdellovibrio bacteriovorus]UXR66060.1 hypothetical protein EZJ49_07335 [Bdellovibrio bacteriovorus]